MTDWLVVRQGDTPLLVSLPHTGTALPPACRTGLVSPERAITDTDWFVEKLYGFALGLGATIVRTRVSRTVIDVNRDPSGQSLYPGQATTGLVPTETFAGEPLYLPGQEPNADEIAWRKIAYFEPYHRALRTELQRLRASHRRVVLYDCHSIRSRIPRLFKGTLPAFNIGTNDGRSCEPQLQRIVEVICTTTGRPTVANGRFKGGFITRNYGVPAAGIHALQMELAIGAYCQDEANPEWDAEFAAPLMKTLRDVLVACRAWGEA